MKLEKRTFKLPIYWPRIDGSRLQFARKLLPTPGNVLFTLLVAGLFWASSAGAFPLGAPSATSNSTSTIAYQGRLADTSGTPLTGSYPMIFRLYSAASGGSPLWEETWSGPNSVQVSDGLFNVMLGSLIQIPQSVVTGNSNLWLGITVGSDDEMLPRVQLGTVPFAVQALTVPDGSITTAKLANGSVTAEKLQGGGFSEIISTKITTSEVTLQNTADFIPIPDLNLTINTQGENILLLFRGSVSNDSVSGVTYFDFNVDGVSVGNNGRGLQMTGVSTPPYWIPITMYAAIPNLASGQHTITVMWKNSSGISRLRGSSPPAEITVIKLR